MIEFKNFSEEEMKEIGKRIEERLKNKEYIYDEEIEKIRKTGIKKKVNDDDYFPDPCDCESCMNYDDENDLCKKNNEYFYHDPHESGIECNEYNYIYELEKN